MGKVKLESTAGGDPDDYLGRCDVIDWDAPMVKSLADELTRTTRGIEEAAGNCF